MESAMPNFPRSNREMGGAMPIGAALLLPLPACHQGVYARRSLPLGPPKAGPDGRAMERVGVRGPFHKRSGNRHGETPPRPSSPRKWGEEQPAASHERRTPRSHSSPGGTLT